VRTAIDTNILSALWSQEPSASRLAQCIWAASREGGLAISAAVYVELLAYPGVSVEFVDQFLKKTGIMVDFALPENVWREAGRRFAAYCENRRRTRGDQPKRLLADFLVGTHALLMADQLLTLDVSRYRTNFPDLRLATAG
jgi:predicted nucleic acid-binding protein